MLNERTYFWLRRQLLGDKTRWFAVLFLAIYALQIFGMLFTLLYFHFLLRKTTIFFLLSCDWKGPVCETPKNLNALTSAISLSQTFNQLQTNLESFLSAYSIKGSLVKCTWFLEIKIEFRSHEGTAFIETPESFNN